MTVAGTPDLLSPRILHDRESLSAQLAEHRLHSWDDAIVWSVDSVVALQSPVVIDKAVVKRWYHVSRFASHLICPQALQLHRSSGIAVGSRRMWRLSLIIVALLLAGSISCVVSPRSVLVCFSSLVIRPKLNFDALALPEAVEIPADDVPITLAPAHNTLKLNAFTQYRFKVRALIVGLRLMWAVKDIVKTPLATLCNFASQLSLATPCSEKVQQWIGDGTITLPKKSVMYESCVKLDVLFSLFLRSLLPSTSHARYLSNDSSPQKGWNISCGRVILFAWRNKMSHAEVAHLDMKSCRSDRNMPLSTLGYGAASLQHKAANFCQKLMAEAGSTAAFDQVRKEVVGYTSDGGVDFGIVDACILHHDHANINHWQQLVLDIKEGRVSPSTGIGTNLFLFPNALGMPDHAHMIFEGALKDAVTKSVAWKPLENAFHDISVFMANNGLKMRMIALCVKSKSQQLALESYVGKHTSWKWENLSQFLTRTCPLLPILISCFDANIICKGLTEDKLAGVAEVSAAIIRRAAAALQFPDLLPIAHLLRVITRATDKQATRLEGCHCHEHLLGLAGAPGQSRQKLRAFRAASCDCLWKACRGTDLALGMTKDIVDGIAKADDPWLRECYAKASPATRIKMKELEVNLKAMCCQTVTFKLGFWNSLPFGILGLFGESKGIASLDRVFELLRCLRSEYDEACRAGIKDKLHRVAHLFFEHGTALRAQLDLWEESRQPLQSSFPHLYSELRKYALIPVMCRRIEASHAEFKNVSKKITNGRFRD
jgi:hypothetical protein